MLCAAWTRNCNGLFQITLSSTSVAADLLSQRAAGAAGWRRQPRPLPLQSRSEIYFEIASQSHCCAKQEAAWWEIPTAMSLLTRIVWRCWTFNTVDPCTRKAQVKSKGRTISHRRRDHVRVPSVQYLPPPTASAPGMRLPGPLQCRNDTETTGWKKKQQTPPSDTHLKCKNFINCLSGAVWLSPLREFSPHRDHGAVSLDPLREHSASRPLLWQAEVSRTRTQRCSGWSSGSVFCLSWQTSTAHVCPLGRRNQWI